MTTLPRDLSPVELELADRLRTAAGTGDVPAVRNILISWPSKPSLTSSLSYYDEKTWPFRLALHTAIHMKQADVVSCVLSFRIGINGHAVRDAVDARSEGVFQAFLESGWDLNMPIGETEPPALAYLVLDESLVHQLLAHGASPNAPAGKLARTPIMSAAASAPLSIVRLLFAHGARVADTLQSAAESPKAGRVEVMAFLLDECGAQIDAVKWRDSSPESYSQFDLFELGTALHYAAKSGFVDKVKFLLGRGADAEVRDSTGKTALDLARAYQRSDIEEILIAWRQHQGVTT